MTSPETLHMKDAINEHSFPLDTHTAYFNTQFGRYGFWSHITVLNWSRTERIVERISQV
jgi:hypothetical protein